MQVSRTGVDCQPGGQARARRRHAVPASHRREHHIARFGPDRRFAFDQEIFLSFQDKPEAGIVGAKKFAYDIWGDTVNTAARMEEKSEAWKINISQTTYELVKDKHACTYRGEIEAKNKGKLSMYFVEE